MAIVKLTEYPEWKVFVDECLDKSFKEIDKPCESYFINKELAGYDAGQKRSIELIKHFVKKQSDVLKLYDEKRQIEKDGAASLFRGN